MGYAFALCLSLFIPVEAAERMKPDPCADRKGSQPNIVTCNQDPRHGIETIKGEVLRVDGDDYLVRVYGGKEVSLRVDSATEMSEPIGRGDRIEAKVREVNDEKSVLSLRQVDK